MGHTGAVTPLPITHSVPEPVFDSSYIEPEVAAYPSDLRHSSRPPHFLKRYWRAVGGGSLLVSLLIHAGIIAAAILLVIQNIHNNISVDFLPGGGSKGAGDADKSVSHQVQQKRQNTLKEHTPLTRIVSVSTNVSVALPDIPINDISLPDASSLMKSGPMGGGFGSSGEGGGFGSGRGSGGVNGFVASTVWGRKGGDGLMGIFYDLKQDAQKQSTGFVDGEGTYAEVVNKAAAKHFDPAIMKGFYHSKQQLIFSFLLVPNIPAEDGPKSFNMEKEVQPRDWFVHYTGTVVPPQSGDWRFVGFFDDLLVVYINGKPVLDASWYSLVNFGKKNPDMSIRQDFGGPPLSGNRHAYFGKWVHLDGSAKLDIVTGERPGGRCGGLLLVQKKDETYKMRPDGTPILPLFCTYKLDNGDRIRMKDYSKMGAQPFELAEVVPIFEVRKPLMSFGPAP